MSRKKRNESAEEVMWRTLRRQHEGMSDYAERLEVHLQKNPDDKWARGNLEYAKREVARLAELLGTQKYRPPTAPEL
jgi:ribosomal protein S15P/S13E